MANAEFVKGLYAKPKHQNAPTFVVCKLSAKRQELIDWLETRGEEWINMDVKIAKSGDKLYVQVDTWKKENAYTPDESTHNDDAEGPVEKENEDGSIDIVYPEEEDLDSQIPF